MSRNSFVLIALMTAVGVSNVTLAQTGVPKEVVAIAGRYQGNWTSYGVDESGRIVERMTWTDVLDAKNPTIEGDQAYVSFTNAMTARGANEPFMTISGKEGYTLNDKGTVGDYFIETFGHTYRAKKLSDNAWAYSMPAHPQELAALGFSNVVSGEHVMVKLHTVEDGFESHRVSRVTTVNWNDAEGKSRWIQFTSLQGTHRRVEAATPK